MIGSRNGRSVGGGLRLSSGTAIPGSRLCRLGPRAACAPAPPGRLSIRPRMPFMALYAPHGRPRAGLRGHPQVAAGPDARPATTARTALARTGAALLALAGAVLPVRAQDDLGRDGFDSRDPRLFTLSEDREAARLASSALLHREAARWDRCVADLQRLVEAHGTNVLGESFASGGMGPPSVYERHVGAGAWAEAALRELPPEGLAVYEARFGPEADRALERAMDVLDRRALIDLAHRWPVSRASLRAWWALGDLELSRGNLALGALAWQHASGLARRLDPSDESEASALRFAALAELETRDLGVPDVSLTLASPTVRTASAPRDQFLGPFPGELEPWFTPLPSNPFASESSRDSFNLYPIVQDDTVFVSTSLEVLAFEATEGTQRWRTPRPYGWDELGPSETGEYFRAIDTESTMIAPAAGSGVVVAALQVPVSIQRHEDFQGLAIMRRIPQRRLFAFDVATGERLWDHAPPRTWTGQELGDFAREMAVTGPPIVHDGRVFVTCGRMEGRVKLHVACYDLHTGELEWQSQVLTGQRELNMFNRHEKEYSGAPVTVAGDRLVVVTHLGTVAALDLLSGRILWQALYDQIPLPGTTGFLTAKRPREWRNAPAVVARGTVLATPLDCEDLLGIDLATGRVRWAYPLDDLRPSTNLLCRIDTLLGASEDTLFLGGPWLASWRRPDGFDSPKRFVEGEVAVDLSSGSRRSRSTIDGPRAMYTGELLLVPARTGLRVFDARSGLELSGRGFEWTPGQQGNLGLGEGLLVSLTARGLQGWLDMTVLEDRARERYAAQPDDPGAALALAGHLDRRARSELVRSSPAGALALHAEAHEVLGNPAFDGREDVLRARVENLRGEARVHVLLGDAERAVDLLEQALASDADRAARRDALLDLERVLRERDRTSWRALLARSDDVLAGQWIGPEELTQDPRWLAFLGETAVLVPEAVPAEVWSGVLQALDRVESGEAVAGVARWQHLIQDHGEIALGAGTRLRDLVLPRLEALLAQAGPDAYAPFAAAARAELETALAQGDTRALEQLPQRYPFAPAVDDAYRNLLEDAYDQGDLTQLARSVSGLLASARRDAAEGPRSRTETELLLALALGAGRAGNTILESRLVSELAREHPDEQCTRSPYEGWRLGDLADALAEREASRIAAGRPLPATFDESASLAALYEGAWEMLPPLVIEGEQRSFLLQRGELLGFDASRPLEPAIRSELDLSPLIEGLRTWHALPTTDGGRLIVADGARVLAYDAVDGSLRWTWPNRSQGARDDLRSDSGELLHAALSDGVVVVHARDLEGSSRAVGIEASTGARLWATELPRDGNWLTPVTGDGLALFLDREYDSRTRALLLDAFTGRDVLELELPEHLGVHGPRRCFLEHDLLFVAGFYGEEFWAFDPHTGRERFRISAGLGRDLSAVLRHDGRLALLFTPSALGGSGRPGELVEVSPTRGDTRRLHELRLGEELIGVRLDTITRLTSPWAFFVTSTPGARRTPLTAVEFGKGRRWSNELPLSHEELWNHRWTQPYVSEDLATVVYAAKEPGSGRRRLLRLDFYDLGSGFSKDSRLLSDDFEDFGQLELFGLGNSLWIGSLTSSGRSDRIEIWR